MNRFLIASLALLPAVPGLVRIVGVFRTRSGSRSRSIIMWGALTMVAAVVLHAGVAIWGFSDVANAPPESKALVMSRVLDRGSLAVWTGLVAGAFLCVFGGMTRSFFQGEGRTNVGAAQPGIGPDKARASR